MARVVFSSIDNLEVLGGIIYPIVIDVVNDFVFSQRTPDFFFGNDVRPFHVSLLICAMMAAHFQKVVTLRRKYRLSFPM